MKIFNIIGLSLVLSGCLYAGDWSVYEKRNAFVEKFFTYEIDYYNDEGPKLIKTEVISETSFKPNEVLRAYKGYPMVNTKTYIRSHYTQEDIIAPKEASLVSGLSPLTIEEGKKYNVIGHVDIENNRFALVKIGDSKDVFLVNNDGSLYKNIGSISNDRLILLEGTQYAIIPNDFFFQPVANNKVVQSEMMSGFELRFDGIKLDRIVLKLLEYNSNDEGEFSTYTFPKVPSMVNIRGVKIKILEVSDAKIEYMIAD